MPNELMPIITGQGKRWDKKIPLSMLNEEWANKNHGQTLNRLAERGGLSPCEAVAIMDKRKWRTMPEEIAIELLEGRLNTRPNQEDLAEAVELLGDIGNDLIKCVPIFQEHGLTNTAIETLKTIEQIETFLSKRQGGS